MKENLYLYTNENARVSFHTSSGMFPLPLTALLALEWEFRFSWCNSKKKNKTKHFLSTFRMLRAFLLLLNVDFNFAWLGWTSVRRWPPRSVSRWSTVRCLIKVRGQIWTLGYLIPMSVICPLTLILWILLDISGVRGCLDMAGTLSTEGPSYLSP